MRHPLRLCAALLLAASHVHATPDAQWRKALFSVTRQEVHRGGFVLGAADGDIAVSARAYDSLRIDHRDPTSLAPTATQRLNQVNVDESDASQFRWTPVVACPDGGQIVVEIGSPGLVKLDAQGRIVARRRIDVIDGSVVRLDANRIVVVSRLDPSLRVMAVATADLSIQWIRALPLPVEAGASVKSVGVLADNSGGTALATVRYSSDGIFSSIEYAYQLDTSTGAVRWSTRIAGVANTPYINADALSDDSYFVSLGDRPDLGTGPSMVRRFSLATGAPIWQANAACPLPALAVSSTRVFAAGRCGARLLDASNGQPLWTSPADTLSPGAARFLPGGDVLMSGQSATASNPTIFEHAFVRRLGAATGGTAWQWDHPDSGDITYISDLRIAGSSVYVVANDNADSRYIDGDDVFRLDAAVGTQQVRAHLDDPSPVFGGSRVVDAGHVLQYGSTQGLELNEIVVQKLASADGTPDWTVALSEDYAYLKAQKILYTAVTADGALGVFAGYPYSTANGYADALEVYEVEVATGARRWRKRFSSGGNATMSAAGIAYDTVGNPVIAYSVDPKPQTFGFSSRTVAKFSRLDGTALWSKDLDATTLSVDAIAALSDDVLVQSRVSVAGSSGGRLERRAGSDGSVVWTHDFDGAFTSSSTYAQSVVAPNGDVVVARPVLDTTFLNRGATLRVERLAAATGAPLWTKSFAAPRHTYVPGAWLYFGSDGGLYVGYAGRNTVSTTNAIVTQRLDPATGDPLWHDERYYSSARGVTNTASPDLGADGVLRVRGTFDGSWSAYDLEFQSGDGSYLGARKQYACPFLLPLVDDDCSGGFSRRDRFSDGSLYGVGVLGSATEESTQTAIRTIPALPLHGELSLTMNVAPVAAPFGDAFRRDFTATATYHGASSTHPFALRLLSEFGGSVDHWTCSAAGGSSCGTAQGQGEVVIDAGLADGDSVTISGQILQDAPNTTWQPVFTVDAPYDIALGCMANDNLQSACLFPIFDDSFE